jgi:hypothetical protein
MVSRTMAMDGRFTVDAHGAIVAALELATIRRWTVTTRGASGASLIRKRFFGVVTGMRVTRQHVA